MKKLKVQREVIRRLSNIDLEHIQGGAIPNIASQTCSVDTRCRTGGCPSPPPLI